MNLVIFGANGPTGRLLTRDALAAGHTVRALTRRPDAFPIRHDQVQVIHGDVYDASSVNAAIEGTDAALSVLGVPYSRQPIRVYSQGTQNIVQAMTRGGVRRLMCVSSSSASPHHDPNEGLIYSRLILPLVTNVIGRTTYQDMRRMEALVRASALDWTIVRPAGLFSSAGVTPYLLGEDFVSGRFTSRQDLADSMLRQLSSDRFVRQVMAVVTTTQKPSLIPFIWQEVFKRP